MSKLKSFQKDFKESLEQDKSLDFIIKYESGLISSKEELINGFQSLLDSGIVWELKGSYQRMAIDLINQGLIIESY
jgi:hypothetical protein